MPGVDSSREKYIEFPMKRPGLTSLTLAATLFVAANAPAQQDAAILAAIEPRAEAGQAAAAGSKMQANNSTADMKQSPDLNGDTYDAMLALQTGKVAAEAAAKPAEPGAAFREKMLDMFDKNNDGQLDVTERMAARKYAEEHGLAENGKVREELLKRFDKNGNGRIDADEAAAMRTFLQERQRRMAAATAGRPAMAVKPKAASTADMAGEAGMETGASASMAADTPMATRKAEKKAERKMEKADPAKVVEELAKKREESMK
jgi:hypothetical protein